MKHSFLLTLLTIFLFVQLSAQTPALVYKSVNSGSVPQNFADVNGLVYFAAYDYVHGSQVWKSDGTDAGTTLLTTKLRYNVGSGQDAYPYDITNVNGTVFFSALGNLWKSDGTDSGTIKIIIDTAVGGAFGSTPTSLVNFNGVLYFSAMDFFHNSPSRQLWKSDGSQVGTVKIKQIGADASPNYLTIVNGVLYFTAYDGINGVELWKSDGTAAGTIMVKDINNGINDSSPINLTNVNGVLYFTADDGIHGFEPWKSDGTAAGTVMIKDIESGINGSSSSYPGDPNYLYFININGVAYFVANDGINGAKLWKTDGTGGGTFMVQDGTSSLIADNPEYLTKVNGVLYFSAVDNTGANLWKTDGTAVGTVMVKTFGGGIYGFPSYLTNVNGVLYFAAQDSIHGLELWKSDGTNAGTQLVKDINAGGSSSPGILNKVNGTLYFDADDGIHGYELWKSDGTNAGTQLVKDINAGSSLKISNLASSNNLLYFTPENNLIGQELWKSDGTITGSVLVKDIRTNYFFGSNSSTPSSLTNVNNELYFAADDGVNGGGLWKSNGTDSGTIMLVNNNSVSSGLNVGLTDVNGILFFINQGELWKTDGTILGTTLVKSGIGIAFYPTLDSNFVNIKGVLYFTADDGISGLELWKSNGTDAGTIMVKDIYSGSFSSTPINLKNVNGILYFTADDGIHGKELWKSDGTDAGTVMVKDIYSGTNSSEPAYFANVNGTLYFTADDPIHGYELWKSDGTAAGTVLVKDIINGIGSSSPYKLTNVNGVLFFQADNGINGVELWKSDGTAAGTVMVKDIYPGINSSIQFTDLKVTNLINVNGVLYFYADDGIHGLELWKSDGSTAGTVLVTDLRTGIESSSPSNLTSVNGILFFTADDGIHGISVWKLNSNIPLPVTFTKFNVTLAKDKVQLLWTTATEINSSNFKVQRSVDGISFETIATLPAAGNSSTLRNYIFDDVQSISLKGELLFFRIVEADVDGRLLYTNIKSVKIPGGKNLLTLTYNPVQSEALLKYESIEKVNVQIRVVDQLGKVIFVTEKTVQAGTNDIRLKTGNFSKGIYEVELISNNDHQHIRMMKE